MKDRLIAIGKILSYHGNRGKLKVFSLSYDKSRFDSLGKVYLVSREDRYLVVTHLSTQYLPNGNVLLNFKEINSAQEAQEFAGGEVRIPESEKTYLPEGVFFHFQLEGLKVIDCSGKELGVLESVMELPSNDVYIVRKATGKQFLVPAIYDVVKDINLDENTMTIEVLEGLID